MVDFLKYFVLFINGATVCVLSCVFHARVVLLVLFDKNLLVYSKKSTVSTNTAVLV